MSPFSYSCLRSPSRLPCIHTNSTDPTLSSTNNKLDALKRHALFPQQQDLTHCGQRETKEREREREKKRVRSMKGSKHVLPGTRSHLSKSRSCEGLAKFPELALPSKPDALPSCAGGMNQLEPTTSTRNPPDGRDHRGSGRGRRRPQAAYTLGTKRTPGARKRRRKTTAGASCLPSQ